MNYVVYKPSPQGEAGGVDGLVDRIILWLPHVVPDDQRAATLHAHATAYACSSSSPSPSIGSGTV